MLLDGGNSMSFKLKKNLLIFISLITTLLLCLELGFSVASISNYSLIIIESICLLTSFLPFIVIIKNKKINNLYPMAIFFAICAYLATSISSYVLSTIGILISLYGTEEEEGKITQLLKKHPFLSAFSVILIGLSFLSISSVISFFSELTYGMDMLGEVIACFFLFILFKVTKKTSLIFGKNGSLRESIIVSLPFLVYIAYIGTTLLAMGLAEGHSFVSFDNAIAIVLLYLAVGIFEDFLIRGLSLNILLDKYGQTRKGIWLSVIVSSLLFGAIHFSNILTGASFTGVLIQVISASFIGMYFSAIYLRSGNVWVVALLHGIYDLVASIPSLFQSEEIIDTTLEYAESISNYSWGSVIFSLVFVALAIFLLRKKKMSNVFAIREGREIVRTPREKNYIIGVIAFSVGVTITICTTMFISLLSLNDVALKAYDKILPESYFQDEYGLIYQNDITNYDSLSDEIKLLLVIYNLEDKDYVNEYSITDAETDVKEESITTYIKKDQILEKLKSVFGKNDNFKYVDVKVSNKTSCHYQEADSMYQCTTINNQESNHLKVYTNIKSINLENVPKIEVLVYYLVEDTETKTIYADSSLQTVYRYNTTISDLVGDTEYNENDSRNRKFWNEIKKQNNDFVPTYRLTFVADDSMSDAIFVSSEPIENKKVNNQKIDEKINKYTSDKYSFEYDKNVFDVETKKDLLSLTNEGIEYINIKSISSDEWLNMYKNNYGTNVSISKYYYFHFDNKYLIYNDGFYIITINDNGVYTSNINDVLNSLEFN